ncbi:MAG: hypothetical protein ACI9YL_001337 [Luteibaculaceae bacterium]|jgi:hypothetical protein
MDAISAKQSLNLTVETYSPLVKESFTAKSMQNIQEKLGSAELFSVDSKMLQEIAASDAQLLELVLPYKGENLVLSLEPYSPLTADFKVNTPNGYVAYTPSIQHFRGVVKGAAKSVVGISVWDNQIHGIITTEDGNLNLGKLDDSDGLFVIYNDREMPMPSSSYCGVTKDMQVVKPKLDMEHTKSGGTCVKVYMELNYDVYQDLGSVNAATNFIAAVFNEVSILYSNENLNVQMSEVFVWTQSSPYSTASSTTALNDFKAYRTSFNGDLAHLVDLKPSNGGIAYVDVLCVNNYAYGYSGIYTEYQEVPTYSWTVEVITHELGHNIGSPHTMSCDWPGGPIDNCYAQEGACLAGPAPENGGTIMSYCHLTSHGINFNHGFGPLPGDLIRERTAAASCLGTCGPVCEVPSAFQASNVSTSSATVSWNGAASATSFNVRYRTSGASWTNTTSSSASINLSGLAENTNYEVQVESVCPELSSGYSATFNFTTASTPVPCGIPTNLSAANVAETSADLSWTTAQNAQSFVVAYKPQSSGSFTETAVSGTSTSLSGLMDNTTYEAKVKSICSNSQSDYSAVITFTTPESQTPIVYCNSQGNSTADEWIASVAVGSLTNNSGNNSGYAYFTGGANQFEAGSAYNLTLTPGFSSGGFFGSNSYPEYWRIWIDLNHDGDFTDAGELVFDAGGTSETTVTGSMTIPAGSASVETRMRIAMKYNGAPTSCEAFGYGEVEDYNVIIGSVEPDPCNAPQNLAVTGTSETSISLAWNAAGANETGYTLEYRATGGSWSAISTSGSSYTVTGLANSSNYEFRVKASCGSEDSPYSAIVSGTTDTPASCDTPTGLAATATSLNSISMAWNAAGVNETGYVLDYRASGGSWTSVSTSGTSYTFAGLNSSTTYDFRVKANCDADASAYSSVVSATTDTPIPCDAPIGLAATTTSTSSISMAWSAAGANETGYVLDYRVSGGSWTSVATSGTSYTVSGLSAQTSYDFRVKANCGSDVSAYSAEVSASTDAIAPCDTPTGLAASNVTTNAADVSWSAVSGAVSYEVQFRASGASWSTSAQSGTSFNLGGLSANSSYDLRVRTLCSESNSSYSGVVSFTTAEETGPPSGYCNSQGNSTSDEWIESFTINGTTYTSGNNGGYADFTAYTISLPAGSSTGITLRPGFNSGFFGPTTYPEYWRVWIDFNKDGDFDDANELAFDAGGTSSANVSGNVVVPSGAASGLTRMRISMKYNGASTPCESFGYGEVEDFLVNVTANMPNKYATVNFDQLEFNMALAPNPAHNNKSTLMFDLTEGQTAGTIRVFDITGRIIHNVEFAGFENETYEQELLLPSNQKGYYLVQVNFENGVSKTQRLVND